MAGAGAETAGCREAAIRLRRRMPRHGAYPRARGRDLLHDVPSGAGRAKVHVQVCGTTPCMLRGAEDLIKVCRRTHRRAGRPCHAPTATFSWDEVECLGACVQRADGADRRRHLRGSDAGEFGEDARRSRRRQAPVKPGPQIDRQFSGAASASRQAIAHRQSDVPRRSSVTEDHARRQGPHLHQSLRPARLGPGGRARARRLGRHQGDPREGPRLDHQRDEGVRPARARRRRLPDRPEMVVHAEEVRRTAALSRRQCRRVRARHLQGPRDHAARSASAGRGLPDRRLRHGRERRLHLCARRIHPRARAPAGGGRSGL